MISGGDDHEDDDENVLRLHQYVSKPHDAQRVMTMILLR